MFYFDDVAKKYELECLWDKVLLYLEEQFDKQSICEKLNSLVGFSWYYFIEGAAESKKFDKDENGIALDMWKKYLKMGINEYSECAYFCFIAGYTLLMHGFFIDEYKSNHEQLGLDMLNKAYDLGNVYLKELVNCILKYRKQKKYKRLSIKEASLRALFTNNSLLDDYFIELFN